MRFIVEILVDPVSSVPTNGMFMNSTVFLQQKCAVNVSRFLNYLEITSSTASSGSTLQTTQATTGEIPLFVQRQHVLLQCK